MISHFILEMRRSYALYRFKNRLSKKFPTTTINPQNIFDLNKVTIGRYCYGHFSVRMWANPVQKLEIGDFVSIAADTVFILGGNHSIDTVSTFPFPTFVLNKPDISYEEKTNGPVIVKDDVWIGTKAIILSGVTIHQGAVVAAGSVVTKDIPPYCIAGGNPAKVIRKRFDDETIEILLSKADYKKLTEEKIAKHINLLKQPLTKDNLDEILSVFG